MTIWTDVLLWTVDRLEAALAEHTQAWGIEHIIEFFVQPILLSREKRVKAFDRMKLLGVLHVHTTQSMCTGLLFAQDMRLSSKTGRCLSVEESLKLLSCGRG